MGGPAIQALDLDSGSAQEHQNIAVRTLALADIHHSTPEAIRTAEELEEIPLARTHFSNYVPLKA
jgi:hypothetical protein